MRQQTLLPECARPCSGTGFTSVDDGPAFAGKPRQRHRELSRESATSRRHNVARHRRSASQDVAHGASGVRRGYQTTLARISLWRLLLSRPTDSQAAEEDDRRLSQWRALLPQRPDETVAPHRSARQRADSRCQKPRVDAAWPTLRSWSRKDSSASRTNSRPQSCTSRCPRNL